MLQFKEILSYIFVIGAAQAIQLAVFLLRKKENKTANKLLAITMIIFSIDFILGVLYVTGNILKFPQLIILNISFPFLYGPNIYLYVLLLTKNQKNFKPLYLLNYIPFFTIHFCGLFIFYFKDQSFYATLLYGNQFWYTQIITNLIPVSGIIYTAFSVMLAIKYNKAIRNSFSNIDKINLKWLIYLVTGTIIIWLIVVFAFIVELFAGTHNANLLIYVGMSVFLFGIGYKSLKQPEVSIVKLQDKEEEDSKSKTQHYKKSGLSDAAASDYLNKLFKYVEENKPYLKNDLNVSDLAAGVEISTHNLSEIINSKLGQNFYDFINKYRIEEVKKLIEKDKNTVYSILALGYDAGFSSKSAFYSAFKKVTGITPAQYRSDIQKNKAV